MKSDQELKPDELKEWFDTHIDYIKNQTEVFKEMMQNIALKNKSKDPNEFIISPWPSEVYRKNGRIDKRTKKHS